MNAGEFSELISGFREDIQKFSSGCKILENAVPLVEGGAKKMPGTYFAGSTANGGAMFTASIAGTTMTVTAVNYGVLQVGQTIVGVGVASGTTVSAYGTGTGGTGTYTITPTQTVASETMQTASDGKSRLVPFQFSTSQGAVLELSAGIIRVWEGATEGDWFLGLVSNQLSGDYDPTVLYSPGDKVSVGQSCPIGLITNPGSPVFSVSLLSGGSGYGTPGSTVSLSFFGTGSGAAGYATVGYSFGNIVSVTLTSGGSGYTSTPSVSVSGPGSGAYVSATVGGGYAISGSIVLTAPYGEHISGVTATVSTNTSNALSVTITGSSPAQGINIALANATPANNSAVNIQAAIRSLVSLNSASSNFIDLSKWTVTPDPTYYASPWITFPTGKTFSFIGPAEYFSCSAINQNDHFPFAVVVSVIGGIPSVAVIQNSSYWTIISAPPIPPIPIELTTPYAESDLFALDCSTQSADVLWIFHSSYPPACVERFGPNLWKYSLSLPGQQPGEPAYRGTLDVVKTGYSALGQNISLISQANPCTVVLASSSSSRPFQVGDRIYINLGAGLVELNEGEFLVRSIAYGPVSIPVVDASGTGSTVTAIGWYMTLTDPDSGTAIDSTSYLQYQGGGFAVKVVSMFAAAGDYPACGTLYQERLCVGGTNNNPTQIKGSVEGDYPDFICDPNEDDYAIQYTLVSNQVNQLLNMIGTPNALLAGTSGGVWVIQGSNGSSSSLSQTNVSAVVQSTLGIAALQPQLVNGSAIFVSRSTRIVTFLLYSFQSNTWENIDLTRLNRSITIGSSESTSGIAQTAFQMEPYPIFWAVRNDGQLLGLVFNTQDQVFGWFRINMVPEGGYIESAAVITGSGQEDQLVVVVNRTVNGVVQRYVEYFMPQEIFSQLPNAFFVHSGQQLQGVGPFEITGITNTNPPVVTVPGHTFTDGMTVQITQVNGMVSPTGQAINQDATEAYTVTGVSGNTFELQGMDTSTWTPYVSGGSVSQVFNQVTGVSYLLGNTVVAVGDGAIILDQTEVTSDAITFDYYANLITIGIPYDTTIQPTNPVLSSQGATSRGMPQKLNRVTLSLYQSMGGQYGNDLDHMYDITYGQGTKLKTPQMSTGEFTRDMDCDWTEESTFIVRQSDPLPFCLRGIIFRLSANQD
jgi:hypothetical protein